RMPAHFDVVERHSRTQLRMHGLHRRARDARLVGGDNDQKTARAKRLDRLAHAGKNHEFFELFRPIRSPAADLVAVDDPVAVEEYGPVQMLSGPTTANPSAAWPRDWP